MWPGIIQCTKELKRTKRGGQMNGLSGEGKLIEKASWMSLVLTPVTLTPPPQTLLHLLFDCSPQQPNLKVIMHGNFSRKSPTHTNLPHPAACPSSGCPPSLRHTSLVSPITGDDTFLPRLPGCSLIPSLVCGSPSVC